MLFRSATQEPSDLGWTTTQQTTDAAPEHAASLAPLVPTSFLPTSLQPTSLDPTSLGAPAPPPPPTEADVVDARPDLAAGVVVVVPGDTLWDLAAARLPTDATNAQIAATWHAWYDLNAAVIGADPDLLHPGQVLQVPPAT